MATNSIDPTASINENDENLIFVKTQFRRRSKGPIMFNGCSPLGDVIILDNISAKKSYDLTGWSIERQTDSQAMLNYTFPERFVLPPSTAVELWSSTATPIPNSSDPNDQQTFLIKFVDLPTWNQARQWSITRLFDATGRERAIFLHRTLTPPTKEKKNSKINID